MNYAMVLYILGYICNVEALLMLLPLGVGLLYGESVGDTFGLTIVLLILGMGLIGEGIRERMGEDQ